MWNAAAVKALRKSRQESQEDFAKALGVARPTVSEWERGAVSISDMGAAALDALARAPRDVSGDYWRGVLYAAEAMAETTHRLLREARQATDATVMQTVAATLVDLPRADAPSPTETGQGARRTTALRGKGTRG